jgi:protein-S-isoprenylcysteine O-methyltransferase Ste14
MPFKLYPWRDAPVILAALAVIWLGNWQPLGWVFAPFYAIAVLLRIRARQWIGSHSRTRTLDAPTLLQQGPYKHSRNPLYVSNLTIIGCWAFMSLPLLLAFVLFIILILHYSLVIQEEETWLLKQFKESYIAYQEQTPRWFCRTLFTEIIAPSTPPINPFFSAFSKDYSTWMWQILLVLSLWIL